MTVGMFGSRGESFKRSKNMMHMWAIGKERVKTEVLQRRENLALQL